MTASARSFTLGPGPGTRSADGRLNLSLQPQRPMAGLAPAGRLNSNVKRLKSTTCMGNNTFFAKLECDDCSHNSVIDFRLLRKVR